MRHVTVGFVLLAAAFTRTTAVADEPLTVRATWLGSVGFFATGEPMAVDGPDSDTTNVDTMAQPASVAVTTNDVPLTAVLVQAFLYWAGSVGQPSTACVGELVDDTVTFTPPGGSATALTADVCHCSDGGATSYDIQVCRAEVTSLVTSMAGWYVVDGFAAKIENQSTDNASFSLVLVFMEASLPPRRIALFDGVVTMLSTSTTVALGSLNAADPPAAALTWYALDGDLGGSGTEQVEVDGHPGVEGPLLLSDAVNPLDNPMNHTINTQSPVRTDTLGVDIDHFEITAALTPGDTSLNVTYQAHTDKWWLAHQIVSVDVSLPAADLRISKTNSGTETVPGETTVYEIVVTNDGPSNVADAVVTDQLDATKADVAAASWTCAPGVGSGVGTNCPFSGTGGELAAGVSVSLEAGDSVHLSFTVPVLSSATGELTNTATVGAPPIFQDGDAGFTDPDDSDDSATDVDTLTPNVDLSLSKDDGREYAEIGGSLSYAIAVTNSGPSDAPGTSVSDPFPAVLSCTWTCTPAGGATCTGGPVIGDVADTVDLPVGGSLAYVANCSIDSGASGTLTNTAMVTAASGVTETDGIDNSDSDVDQLTVCGEPEDLVLTSPTVSTTETFVACFTITAHQSFAVGDGGDVTLRAGWTVALGAGFSVATGGRLVVEIDPALSE